MQGSGAGIAIACTDLERASSRNMYRTSAGILMHSERTPPLFSAFATTAAPISPRSRAYARSARARSSSVYSTQSLPALDNPGHSSVSGSSLDSVTLDREREDFCKRRFGAHFSVALDKSAGVSPREYPSVDEYDMAEFTPSKDVFDFPDPFLAMGAQSGSSNKRRAACDGKMLDRKLLDVIRAWRRSAASTVTEVSTIVQHDDDAEQVQGIAAESVAADAESDIHQPLQRSSTAPELHPKIEQSTVLPVAVPVLIDELDSPSEPSSPEEESARAEDKQPLEPPPLPRLITTYEESSPEHSPAPTSAAYSTAKTSPGITPSPRSSKTLSSLKSALSPMQLLAPSTFLRTLSARGSKPAPLSKRDISSPMQTLPRTPISAPPFVDRQPRSSTTGGLWPIWERAKAEVLERDLPRLHRGRERRREEMKKKIRYVFDDVQTQWSVTGG